MLIRKNTKSFKTILAIFSACQDRPDRQELIRLYVTKAGDTVQNRISVEGIEGGAGLFYEMNFAAVLGNLKSASHQLHHSDEIPGIYFFHSSSNKVWDETPFEFDEAVGKEFASLPELPVLRKKGKTEKFVFPSPPMKGASGAASKKAGKGKDDSPQEKAGKKAKTEGNPSAKVVAMWPKQPDYKLKHEIHFSGLERIVFRGPELTKKGVLDYYNDMSGYILPWLKDRPVMLRFHREGSQGALLPGLEALKQSTSAEIPDWLQTAAVGKGKAREPLLLCNDREHLLFYAQLGAIEFHAGLARIKSPGSPDYMIVGIESPEYKLGKVAGVVRAAREIFTGLQLPSFLKTDGAFGIHACVPLEPGSSFEVSEEAAGYLCRLLRLKMRDSVAVKDPEDHGRGKVSLDYRHNDAGKAVVAPYSLVVGSPGAVATPLKWDEVVDDLNAEDFTYETILKRLKREGDVTQGTTKKKVDADGLLEMLKERYSFLL